MKKLLIKFLNKRMYIIIISKQGDKAASRAPNTDEKASKISDFFSINSEFKSLWQDLCSLIILKNISSSKEMIPSELFNNKRL